MKAARRLKQHFSANGSSSSPSTSAHIEEPVVEPPYSHATSASSVSLSLPEIAQLYKKSERDGNRHR